MNSQIIFDEAYRSTPYIVVCQEPINLDEVDTREALYCIYPTKTPSVWHMHYVGVNYPEPLPWFLLSRNFAAALRYGAVALIDRALPRAWAVPTARRLVRRADYVEGTSALQLLHYARMGLNTRIEQRQ